MNKLLSAILAGVFAATLSAGAFATNSPSPATHEVTKEKPASPAKKVMNKVNKLEHKAGASSALAK